MTRLQTLLLAVCLSTLACSGSPTEITGGAQIFEGTIAFGETNMESLSITSAGGVRIEVLSVTADPELEAGFTPSLGFGLGEPDDEGECALTFSTIISNNVQPLSIGLLARDYCLTFFDNLTLAEDGTRTYSVSVAPSS